MENDKFQELVLVQLNKLTEGQQTLEKGQVRLESRMNNLELRMENEAFNKLSALSDGYKSLMETLTDHTARLERIEEKVTGHDIKIEVLDRTKANKRKAK